MKTHNFYVVGKILKGGVTYHINLFAHNNKPFSEINPIRLSFEYMKRTGLLIPVAPSPYLSEVHRKQIESGTGVITILHILKEEEVNY